MPIRFLLVFTSLLTISSAQTVFTSGGANNLGLFEQRGNQVVRLNTGRSTHNGMALSRDGRFVTFADVDQNNFNQQVIPSSDLYEYDRATGQTRQLVDNTSFVGGFFNVVSSAISQNNQFVAVGTEIQLRHGLDANGSGRVLEVYDRASRQRVADVTSFRNGAVPDGLSLEFAGISWSPRADSFITPFYIPVTSQRGLPSNLPAIVRFDRQANGQWGIGQVLSTPFSLDQQLPPSVVAQAYPGYSPTGGGIAYFSIFFDGTQGNRAVASVVVADATGQNARTLNTFAPGLFPTGLSWSADGSQIIASVAPQASTGIGFLNFPLLEQSIVRAVSTRDGAITQIQGINGGSSPQIAVNGSSTNNSNNVGEGSTGGVNSGGVTSPAAQDISSMVPTISRVSGNQLLLRLQGLEPNTNYRLQSSTSLDGFPGAADFTGAQFAAGITIPTGEGKKFFRIQTL